MNLTEQIAQLKTDLREFIALSETVTTTWVVKNAQREIGSCWHWLWQGFEQGAG